MDNLEWLDKYSEKSSDIARMIDEIGIMRRTISTCNRGSAGGIIRKLI